MLRFSVLLALALAAPVHADPVILSPEDRPNWLAIGRVNQGGFKSMATCSGALISPTLVLTAAHCVANPKTGVPVQPYKLKFVASWHLGEYAAVGQAKEIHVHPEYATRRDGSLSRIETDIALITLEEPMEGVTPLPLDLSGDALRDTPVKMLGYRFDRPHAVTDYQGCSAYLLRRTMLSIDCDVVKGTSGAPVLTLRDGVWQVAGVVSSRLDNRGRDKALASLIGAAKSIEGVQLPASNPTSNP